MGAPEEAAFSYPVDQEEQAKTPQMSEEQSVSISLFIRRPILINLPPQWCTENFFCLFLLQRSLSLPLPLATSTGRGYGDLFKVQGFIIQYTCYHQNIVTWILSYDLNIFVPKMVNAQLIIILIRRNKHMTWPPLQFCTFPVKSSKNLPES